MGEKIILNKGGGTAETVPMTITLTASDGKDPFGRTVTVTEVGTGEVFKTLPYLGPAAHKLTLSVPVHLHYRVTVDGIGGYETPDAAEGTARKKTPIEITFRYLLGMRYGFRRTIAAADPYARIEYLYDAKGKTPFTMDLTSGTPNYGDWGDFINEVAAPVMLKYDGTEDYELDRSNQTKKAAGGNSDISNTNYQGNAMVRFSKWKWVHRSEDTAYQYVIFSNIQYDDTYHAYAHTDENGKVQDAFYWGMFKGSYSNDKLRSIAGPAVMVGQNRMTEVERAKANGAGYDTGYKSGWDYICDLLTLISKSDNGRSTFGTGRSRSGSNSPVGETKSSGGFWGKNDKVSDVKVFWIEGFWGNVSEGLRGYICDNGTMKAKMTPPYNFEGTGYHNTGKVLSSTGWISAASCTDLDGHVPYETKGTSETYYCSYIWTNPKIISYASYGGFVGYEDICGCRTVDLNNLNSFGYSYFGARLSYIPNK